MVNKSKINSIGGGACALSYGKDLQHTIHLIILESGTRISPCTERLSHIKYSPNHNIRKAILFQLSSAQFNWEKIYFIAKADSSLWILKVTWQINGSKKNKSIEEKTTLKENRYSSVKIKVLCNILHVHNYYVKLTLASTLLNTRGTAH